MLDKLFLAIQELKENTPPCRVQLSSEPAFAGWVPPRKLRLGSGLSRHLRKSETLKVCVGSEPDCGSTYTAGSKILYHITNYLSRQN